MFDEIKEIYRKFGKGEDLRVLDLVVNMAHRMSKQNKDVRDLLELQVPVAIEISSELNEFKANLEIVEKILTGPYDLKLLKDKQRFKAFFEKVGGDLRPITTEGAIETIGLLEYRLQQQGFDIIHFYEETFKRMEKVVVAGAIDIIFEIVKEGFFPTKDLILQAKAKSDGRERRDLYISWRQARRYIKAGNFDINNPLHWELEYSTFRHILDNSRFVSQLYNKGLFYEDYIKLIKDSAKAGKKAGREEEAELIYAAYEAKKLKEFVDEIRIQAAGLGREVWVVPNLRYGRFAAAFIEGDLRLDDVEIVFAKIGSSDTHTNPYYVDPRFLRTQVIQRLVNERPVVIVVDGSEHLERYPDAHKGYLNLAIALNDVFTQEDVSQYASLVGREKGFINSLKREPAFKALREIIQRAYERLSRRDNALYRFYFWTPRGVALTVRERRHVAIDNPLPMKKEDLKGPAFIFANTVLLDKDIPSEIKEKTGGIKHRAAFFDDNDAV